MEGKINIKNILLYSIIALAAAGSVLVMLSTIFGLIFRFFIKVMEIDPNVLIQQQQLIEVASHVIALGIYFIVYKLIFRKDNKIQDEGVKVKKNGPLCNDGNRSFRNIIVVDHVIASYSYAARKREYA